MINCSTPACPNECDKPKSPYCAACREVRKKEAAKNRLDRHRQKKQQTSIPAVDLQADAQTALAEQHQKEQGGELSHSLAVPIATPAAPVRQLTQAEIDHWRNEPITSGPEFEELNPTSQAERMAQKRIWSRQLVQLQEQTKTSVEKAVPKKKELCAFLWKRPERKETDYVIDALKANDGIEHVILYEAGNLTFVRWGNTDRAAFSHLRQNKLGKWFKPDGIGGIQQLAEGSTVTILNIEPCPGEGYLLTEDGKWYPQNPNAVKDEKEPVWINHKLPMVQERPQQLVSRPRPMTQDERDRRDIDRAFEAHVGLHSPAATDNEVMETLEGMWGFGGNATQDFSGYQYMGSDPSHVADELRRIRAERKMKQQRGF